MGEKCVIGIDVGTSGCKVLALDETGDIMGSAVEEYPCYAPQSGWSEQEPEDWWNGVVKGLKHLTPLLRGRTVAAVGLSGQMHGMVALDGDNRPVRRAILWNDQRTDWQCREIVDRAGGLDALLAQTNNRMLTGYTGGKILWMKENEYQNYQNTVHIINPKDYIRLKLTGRLATDVSDASGTGLFCVQKRCWAFDLIGKAGMDHTLFPEVVESTEVSGFVTDEAARLTGLPKGIPVGGGGGDAVISTTGLGLAQSGRIGVTVGTSGVVAMNLSTFQKNPDGLLQLFCGNEPGSFSAMGVTLAAAGSYQWFRNTFGDYEAEHAKATGKSAFYLLDREAAKVPSCSEGMFFLPYLSGERAPLNDPYAKGAFLGVTSRHRKGHFARAVLEGVGFSLRQVYELIGNTSSREIVLAGGGAVSPLWRQIFADVFNLPVKTVYGSAEGGSFGAALTAGVTAGIWKDLKETAALIREESITVPVAENVSVYQKHYEKFVRFYNSLKWSFKE